MRVKEWLDAILHAVPEHIPAIVGALVLVAIGWVVAKLLAVVGKRLSGRLLNRLPLGPEQDDASGARGALSVLPAVIGSFVFWVVLILVVVAAVEILGLPILTDLFSRLAVYLPNIIAAVALVVGGFAVARIARGLVARGATVMRLEAQAEVLAGTAHALILAIAGVMALEQLGIQGRILELVLAVTLGSILAAGGLAFALGARSAVANIVAARYVAQVCRVGQEIEIEGIRGSIVQMTSTAVIVESKEGRVMVPAARFHDSLAVLLKAS